MKAIEPKTHRYTWWIVIFVAAVVTFYLLVTRNEILFSRYSYQSPKTSKLVSLKENGSTEELDRSKKTILFWTPFFDREDYYFGLGQKPFISAGCTVNNCVTISKRQLADTSDAIIFHVRDIDIFNLPPRQVEQRWIFFLLESPKYTPSFLQHLENFFNWTMTYRMDSDIYMPYSSLIRGMEDTTKSRLELRTSLKSKRKLAAWFVSHCPTFSRREKYASELQRYITIDIYGTCGTLKCEDRTKCSRMLSTDYKFYLSFENSICRDYVTEKFFFALANHVVPIVYGGANYSAIAPKHSFIDVRDFVSPKHLADYLLYLNRNMTAYEEYFNWKLGYHQQHYSAWCRLCEMLNNNTLPKYTYKDISHWWVDEGYCKDGNIV